MGERQREREEEKIFFDFFFLIWIWLLNTYRKGTLPSPPLPYSSNNIILRTDNLRAPPRIQKQLLAFPYLIQPDFLPSIDPRQDMRRRQQLERISQTDFHAMLGDLVKRWFAYT